MDIMHWWESRRIRFNIWVGIVGVVTWLLVMIAGSAAVKSGVDFEEPLAMIFGPIVYGILANICFTLGWIVDTVAYRGNPRTNLYRGGLAFSIVLTSLPGAWAVTAWIISVATGKKLD
jgi:hypothetical protein